MIQNAFRLLDETAGGVKKPSEGVTPKKENTLSTHFFGETALWFSATKNF